MAGPVVRELFENTGPPDRLLDLPDCALELPQIVEGCVDHMRGCALELNPYSDEGHGSPRFQSWRRGWLDGCRWRDLREASANESQEDDNDANSPA